MTSNTLQEQNLKPPHHKTKTKSVTLFHGDAYALKFAGNIAALSIGPEGIEGISERRKSVGSQAPPHLESGSPQERISLISMLDLNEKTVAKIDRNARALGLSFASYLSADITS